MPPATAAERPLVQISGLHKSFGPLHVLKGIDLAIARGEKVTLIGPSGSGKTTLPRCVNYLEQPSEGHVHIDGVLLGERLQGGRYVRMNDAEIARMRAGIGMVFQNFNLFPHLTVERNVCIGPIKVRGEDARAAQALGGRTARQGRSCGQAACLSRSAFRRPAPARGDCARVGDAAATDALR